MEIDKIKSTIEKLEKGLNNPVIAENLKSGMKAQLEKLKTQLVEAEAKAEQKVEKSEEKIADAEAKIEEAKKEGDISAEKEAKTELKDAKEEKKEAVAEIKEVEKVSDKIEKIEKFDKKTKKPHGGAGRGQGRKADPNKVVKPKGQRGGHRPNAGRKPTIKEPVVKKSRKLMKPEKATLLKKSKEKSMQAFGQTLTFSNESEFCHVLKKAFRKRRQVYKAKRKKTKPIFGVITSKVADVVDKAIHNVSEKQIQSNPKKVMGYIKTAEKKAKDFLESLKPLMGSDYKHSEIGKEFGEIERSIKKAFSKHK